MAAEITEITESNQVWPDQIYGYLQAMNSKLDQILVHLDEVEGLFAAWDSGGLRGLRQATAALRAIRGLKEAR